MGNIRIDGETYAGEPRAIEIGKEPPGDLWIKLCRPESKVPLAEVVVPAIELLAALRQLGMIDDPHL